MTRIITYLTINFVNKKLTKMIKIIASRKKSDNLYQRYYIKKSISIFHYHNTNKNHNQMIIKGQHIVKMDS